MLYKEIAKRILQTEVIPEDLDKRLEQIDNFCRNAGGALISRQIISVIIYDYMKTIDDGK